MNSKQRLRARLKGEPVDRPPNLDIFMTFAAHYIGEPLSSYYLDYRILSKANLALLEPFQLDLVQAISDPYREAADFGAQVEFPPDRLPLCRQPLLAEPGDLLKLKPPNPDNGRRMSDRLMAVRFLKEQVGEETPVMGWVEGGIAEAADLRGVSSLLVDLYERPEWVLDLLEVIVDVEIQFARRQIAMGADIVGLGDAIASQISPAMYRKFALPYEQRIFQAVHAIGALARLHICGNTSRLLPDMLMSGADIIDLDWMVDFEKASSLAGHSVLGGRSIALCGNMDPVRVFLQGDPEFVYQDTQRALRQGGARCLSAAGCEIPDHTPEENLRAQIKALKEFR